MSYPLPNAISLTVLTGSLFWIDISLAQFFTGMSKLSHILSIAETVDL